MAWPAIAAIRPRRRKSQPRAEADRRDHQTARAAPAWRHDRRSNVGRPWMLRTWTSAKKTVDGCSAERGPEVAQPGRHRVAAEEQLLADRHQHAGADARPAGRRRRRSAAGTTSGAVGVEQPGEDAAEDRGHERDEEHRARAAIRMSADHSAGARPEPASPCRASDSAPMRTPKSQTTRDVAGQQDDRGDQEADRASPDRAGRAAAGRG